MDIQPGFTALVPLILGLVEVLKRAGLESRWAPLASIVLGVAAGVFYVNPENPARGVLPGLILGLSAMGLWSGPKAMIRAFRAHRR